MHFRNQVTKLLNYFITPHLDYKAFHKARLNKRWPFYTERDQKKRTTFALYGTVFSSSHWASKTIDNLNTNVSFTKSTFPESKSTAWVQAVTALTPLNNSLLRGFSKLSITLLLFILLKYLGASVLIATINILEPDSLFEFSVAYSVSNLSAYIVDSCTHYWVIPLTAAYYSNVLNFVRTILVQLRFPSPTNQASSVRLSPKVPTPNGHKSHLTRVLDTVSGVSSNATTRFTGGRRNQLSSTNYTTWLGGVSWVCTSIANSPMSAATSVSMSLTPKYLPWLGMAAQSTKYSVLKGNESLGSSQRALNINLTHSNRALQPIIDLTREGRWLTNNFPSSSNLHANSKKFTNAKRFVKFTQESSKTLTHYYTSNFSNVGSLFWAKNNPLSLASQNFNFFEVSRLFNDQRTYINANLSVSDPVTTPALKHYSVSQPVPGGTTGAVIKTPQLRLYEPYHTHKFGHTAHSQGNPSSYKFGHTNVTKLTIPKTDLLFNEFLNTTSLYTHPKVTTQTFSVNLTTNGNPRNIQRNKY